MVHEVWWIQQGMGRVSGDGVGWALHGPDLQGHRGDGQLLSFPILPSRGPSKDQSSLQAMMRWGRRIKALLRILPHINDVEMQSQGYRTVCGFGHGNIGLLKKQPCDFLEAVDTQCWSISQHSTDTHMKVDRWYWQKAAPHQLKLNRTNETGTNQQMTALCTCLQGKSPSPDHAGNCLVPACCASKQHLSKMVIHGW